MATAPRVMPGTIGMAIMAIIEIETATTVIEIAAGEARMVTVISGGSFQLRQTALNAGFNEGVKQGRTDRKNQNGRGYQGQSTYQNATKDYSSPLGDREVYQRYFREAYEHGYEDGISGN